MEGEDSANSRPFRPDVVYPRRSIQGSGGRRAGCGDATGVIFRETEGDYDYSFHNAPRRQYVINLDASVEIEIGDGTKRILGPGEILLAEDTTGHGHISRSVDGKPRRSLFVTLD